MTSVACKIIDNEFEIDLMPDSAPNTEDLKKEMLRELRHLKRIVADS